MSEIEENQKFLSLYNQIITNGMNEELYMKTANEFINFIHVPSPYLITVLKYFIRFKDDLLYVNEIRNYLKENSNDLFLEYGNKFKNCKGCFEVFGIEPKEVKEYDFKVKKTEVSPKEKKYEDRKTRKYDNRKIKKQAQQIAIEKHKNRKEQLTEKKKKKEELERLIRKQDL